jgi:hypothetical protein
MPTARRTPDLTIAPKRVIRFMARLIEIHGKPLAIRCDNGRN